MTRVETIKHVEGVRARWLGAHADPTINPAWANAERDIGLLLQDYDALAAELAQTEAQLSDAIRLHLLDADRIRALAAELARCRAANAYDGAAHKRVADLEAALREIGRQYTRGDPELASASVIRIIDSALETGVAKSD